VYARRCSVSKGLSKRTEAFRARPRISCLSAENNSGLSITARSCWRRIAGFASDFAMAEDQIGGAYCERRLQFKGMHRQAVRIANGFRSVFNNLE
jgi:hypothetical protein